MMKEFHYLFYFLNGTFGIHVIQRNGVAIIKILRQTVLSRLSILHSWPFVSQWVDTGFCLSVIEKLETKRKHNSNVDCRFVIHFVVFYIHIIRVAAICLASFFQRK